MSTDQKHTAGKLGRNIPPVRKYPVLFAGRNAHVAQIITQGLTEAEAEANADRMVACWNACDGLSDNELTHGPVIALSRYSTLANEKAELAAALRRLKNCPDLNLDSLEPETIEALAQAMAALAKAQS